MSDTTTTTYAHGPGGLLSQPGLGGKRVRRLSKRVRTKAWSAAARAAALETRRRNAVMRGQNAPNADARNLANARHDAAQLAKVPKQPKIAAPKHGGGKGGAKKPKKVAQTTEQKRAARLAARAQNRADTLSKMNIAPDGQQALNALRSGQQPDPAAIARGGFVAAGLVTQAADGSYHMTPAGRAGDTISSARDRATAATAANAAKLPKPPKAGGGGGGGKKTPTPEEKRAAQQQQRTETAASTAPQVGLGAADVDALRQAAESGGARSAALAKRGLIDSDGQATDAGRMALSALERGDVRGYQAAIQNARASQGRASARADHQAQQQRERQARDTQRMSDRQTRANRQAMLDAQRARDRADRIAHRRERAIPRPRSQVVHKVSSSAGDKNDYPDQSQYAGETMEDWDDGLGSRKPSREAVEAARRQFAQALGLPTVAERADVPATKDAAFAVFKDSAGDYRWVMLSSNAFRDRDHEIVSTKALTADVARADSDRQYGPLRWWHVGIPFGPGLDLGDCDFNAMVGRMLIESGTFRSPHFAAVIASKAHDLQGSIGFTHPFDEPDREGVFWHIRRFERSLVPRGKAANPFTQLYVQEISMDETKIKELASLLNIPIEQVQSLVASTQVKEQKLEASGVAFKADDMGAVTENALPPAAPDAESPEEDAAEDGMEEPGDENMLTDAECSHIADMVVAKIAPMLDIEKKIAGHAADIKATMGGMLGQQSAQKDASDAALKEQIQQLQARLKELEGDQPRAAKGYRASLDTDTVTTKPNSAPTADPLNSFVNDFILGGAQPRQ